MCLKKVLSTFFRSEQFKIVYSCVQSFEFIRSAKGHQLNIQKHEILQKIWKFACDLGFAATNCSWIFAPGGRSWQPLAAPRGRKIVITRRSWQLQSSYFACADLWTCWIRFWYSRSPKLTKMMCFWQFSFLYVFDDFSKLSFLYFFKQFTFFNLGGRRHEALAFKLINRAA